MKKNTCITSRCKCDHDGFLSQRGCRKHVNTKHGWFLYFDEKAELQTDLTESLQTQECLPATSTNDHLFRVLPSFSICGEIGQVFTKWLTGSGGGCKKDRGADQIATFKFVKFCCEDEEEDILKYWIIVCVLSVVHIY